MRLEKLGGESHFGRVCAILFFFIFLLAPASSFAEEGPTPAELRAQANRCRKILHESLVDFYLPACLDRKNGGYHEFLEGNSFTNRGEKFLTLQARQLWFFSALAKADIKRDQSLSAARHGYNFLIKKMRDGEFGGYFSKVTDDGEPSDMRKHAYLNAFTLYALATYHQAARDRQSLIAAKALFRKLDEKAYDEQFGGYIEFFERDWTEVTDRAASGYVGAIGQKTYNTHLHLLEAFAELYRVWPDEKVRQRLTELIAINTTTVKHPEVNANVDAWLRDWTMVQEPRNLRASYGHDVECVWLVMDAARAVKFSPRLLLSWAEGLSRNALEFGYDREHGGFFSGGALGEPADDLKKIWWVQAEALPGMLEMYRLTGNLEYYEVFKRTLDFCEKYHVAKEGGWWATRAADGSETADKQRTGPWQGAYHAARAMIVSADWLDELAAEGAQ